VTLDLAYYKQLCSSMPPTRQIASLTQASLAGLPSVQRLTGSINQREIARADDDRAVRGRSVRGRAAPAIRPSLCLRRPRDSDATAPTASAPEAQRARLEYPGDAELEPQS
jgi:hypothetical protein